MGGISFSVKLKKKITDQEKLTVLHRAIWDALRAHMDGALKKKVAKDILTFYTSTEAYEGIEKGRWYWGNATLSFSFSDGGGNCYPQMYASYHWAAKALSDTFKDAAAIAKAHKTELVPAKFPLGDHVFFYLGPSLACAVGTKAPRDDHQVWLTGKKTTATTLADMKPADRKKARAVITSKKCECELCLA